MFVDTGLVKMLNAQLSYLSSLYWKLFPANTAITSTTVLTDLGSEASWSGYAEVNSGTWSSPIIVDPRSQSTQSAFVTFSNADIVDHTFYVRALVDTSDNTLVWADNIGLTTIAAGSNYTFGVQGTDKEE